MKFLMTYLVLATAVGSTVFADSSADDPNRKNMTIEDAFTDSNGGTIIHLAYQSTDNYDSKKLATPNPAFVSTNRTFYCVENTCDQLSETGGGGGAGEMHVWFADSKGAKGEFLANKHTGKYTLTCGDQSSKLTSIGLSKILALQSKLRKGEVVANSLPNVFENEYSFKNGDSYIRIDAPKYNNDSYNKYKAFEGTPGAMTEVKIASISSLRMGGTTILLADGRSIQTSLSADATITSKDGTVSKLTVPSINEKRAMAAAKPAADQSKSPCPASNGPATQPAPAASSNEGAT